MRAGPLNQRVAFDEPVEGQTGSGAETIVWTERFTVWASITPLTGRERLQAGSIEADIDVRISTRWLPQFDSVTAKWRARHVEKGTVYNIAAPPSNVEMRNREIEIVANTGLNEG